MQLSFTGQTVLVRVDFNVPLSKQYEITDDTRIRSALPTIEHLLNDGAAVILCSHLGRPLEKRKADGSIDMEKNTLRHLVQHLAILTGRDIQFAPNCVGAETEAMAIALRPGEILLLENTRFHPEEEAGDEAFAAQLAALATMYVNDAFGTAHRAHASTTTVAHFFDKEHKCFGYLMDAELQNAKRLTEQPEHPFVAIVGGAKVSDKILLLETLLAKVQTLVIGGGMAYTFIKAQGGNIGKSLCEEDKLELALQILAKAQAQGVQVLLPMDSVVANAFSNDAESQVLNSDEIPDGWMGLDIGPAACEHYEDAIMNAKTIFWNGPMGVFEMENFANGTRHIAQAVANATAHGAYSLIGGGDSVAAINQLGLSEHVSYVSTGGGAMLELLEGKTLPGVQAIAD